MADAAVLWLWLADELVLMTAGPTRDEALAAAACWLREHPDTGGLDLRIKVTGGVRAERAM